MFLMCTSLRRNADTTNLELPDGQYMAERIVKMEVRYKWGVSIVVLYVRQQSNPRMNMASKRREMMYLISWAGVI